MADAKFVKDVSVCRCKIGYRELAQQQPLEHWFMNDAPNNFLVRTDGFEFGRFDSWLDELLINGVKIERNPGCAP